LQRSMRPLRVVVPGVLGKHPAEVVGAENPVTSCDVHVLVEEAAEPVSSERADGCARTRGSAGCGRVLIE
jgi:hypothetical protein